MQSLKKLQNSQIRSRKTQKIKKKIDKNFIDYDNGLNDTFLQM